MNGGAWTAFAGLCVQFVGIIWDTLLHHHDPGLAERESVLSLGNPGHVLIASGTSITAIGIGICLYQLARARSTWAAIAVVALITLWLGTMTVTLRTSGLSGKHNHVDPDTGREPNGAARDLPLQR
ncbi:MAG TPA: hypothetical protein VGF21_15275 [Thermoleophilaceae bacterium]